MLLTLLSLVVIDSDDSIFSNLYIFPHERDLSMPMALLGLSGRITLEAPAYTLGSAPENQFVLNDPKVSPRHAFLQLQGQQYSIVDLGSIDGTYLNEQRLGSNAPVFLKHGDRIRIGNTIYVFEAGPPAASAGSAPSYEPTVMAGSSPSYQPTVQASPPTPPSYGQPVSPPPATPGYAQSNPGLPSYGQTPQPAPPPATPYGQPTPQAPMYGQPVPPPVTPGYGQSNPGLPVYGQPPAPGYGQPSQAPMPGQQGSFSSPNYQAYPPATPSSPNEPTTPYAPPMPGTPAPGQPYAQPAPGQPWGGELPPSYVPTIPPAQQKKSNVKLLVIVLIIVLVLAGGGGGIFYIVNLPRPTISVTSTYDQGSQHIGASTTTFTISGQKFSHSSAITFLLDGAAMPGNSTVLSDSNGNLPSTTLTVTDSWTVGSHTITAKDASGYTTQASVKVQIVTPGQSKTPGPHGAPTDSASGTIDATIQLSDGSTSTMTLNVTGSDSGGKVCGAEDDGQPHAHDHITDQGDTITETLVTTCSGSYKNGKLSYTETATSDKVEFTSGTLKGVTCTAQTPYTLAHLEGSFTSNAAANGSFNQDLITATCSLSGSTQTISSPAAQGTWTGNASMQ